MGRWLDALKKHENAPDANLQNPQNYADRGFEYLPTPSLRVLLSSETKN